MANLIIGRSLAFGLAGLLSLPLHAEEKRAIQQIDQVKDVVVPEKPAYVKQRQGFTTCNADTVKELHAIVDEISCWSSFEVSCLKPINKYALLSLGPGIVAQYPLEQKLKGTKLELKHQIDSLEKKYRFEKTSTLNQISMSSADRLELDRLNGELGRINRQLDSLDRLDSAADRKATVRVQGENGDFVTKRNMKLSAETQQEMMLKRLERLTATEAELARVRGIRTLVASQARTQMVKKGLSAVTWVAGGLAFATADVFLSMISTAGNCDDGAPFIDQAPRSDGGEGCQISYKPGKKTYAFLSSPPAQQVSMLQNSDQLCAHYQEMIARLKKDRDQLKGDMENVSFVEAPSCTGDGLEMKVKSENQTVSLKAKFDSTSGQIREFYADTGENSNTGKYRYTMRSEKDATELDKIQVTSIVGIQRDLTPAQLGDLLAQEPRHQKGFHFFRLSQYWTQTLKPCCKVQDPETQNKCLAEASPAVARSMKTKASPASPTAPDTGRR